LHIRIPEYRYVKVSVTNLKADIKIKNKEMGAYKKKSEKIKPGKFKDLSDKLMQDFKHEYKP